MVFDPHLVAKSRKYIDQPLIDVALGNGPKDARVTKSRTQLPCDGLISAAAIHYRHRPMASLEAVTRVQCNYFGANRRAPEIERPFIRRS